MSKIIRRLRKSEETSSGEIARACEEAAGFLGYRVEPGTGVRSAYTILIDERSGETRMFPSRSALSAALCLELMEAAGFRNAGRIDFATGKRN